MVSKGFNRSQYAWFMDKSRTRSGYGDLEWESDGIKHTGKFAVSDDENLALPVEYLICVNEMKFDEPTFVVKINGTHAARIDVNGRHRFSGERSPRQSTHFQCHSRGSDFDIETTEIQVPPFPALSQSVNVNYEVELRRCFLASTEWLNVDVAGVIWSALPFKGGT